MYKTILVPVDIAHIGEAPDELALAKLNSGENCRVVLLNVVEDIPSWAAAQLPRGTLETTKQANRQQLERLVDSVDCPVEIEVRLGHAYQVILTVAEEISADLIIVASHRPGFKDFYLGSTAAKVVRHAQCSVHVIR